MFLKFSVNIFMSFCAIQIVSVCAFFRLNLNWYFFENFFRKDSLRYNYISLVQFGYITNRLDWYTFFLFNPSKHIQNIHIILWWNIFHDQMIYVRCGIHIPVDLISKSFYRLLYQCYNENDRISKSQCCFVRWNPSVLL